MLKLLPLIAALVAFLGRYPCAHAQRPPPVDSIEWMVVDCDRIVRGKLGGNVGPYKAVEVIETLKGPHLNRFLLREVWPLSLNADPSDSTEVLLFLGGVRPDGVTSPAVYELRSSFNGWKLGTPDPQGTVPIAIGMDGHEFMTPSQALDAVRAAIATGAVWSVWETLNFGDRRVIVPTDGRLETLGRAWVQDEDEQVRANGLTALSHFRSPNNIRLLRHMAADDPAGDGPDNPGRDGTLPYGRWATRRFYLREHAYEILKAWHAERERPAIIAPDELYRPILRAWSLLVAAALVAVALAVFQRTLRRLRFGPRLPRPRPAALLALLGTALLLLCIRSYWRADELLIRLRGVDYQLASFCGGVQFSRVSGEPIHPSGGDGIFFLACPRSALDILWSDPFNTSLRTRTLTADWHYFDISFEAGAFQGKSWDSSKLSTFTFLRLPLLPLIFITLPPGFWLLARNGLRHRHRRRAGLCLPCGYNLTGNVSGVCPECGAPAAGAKRPGLARGGENHHAPKPATAG